MSRRWLAAACVTLAACTAGVVRAESLDEVVWTPRGLAMAVEREASRTSFEDLERFGREAAAGHAPDRLARLQHVGWVIENQGEYSRFEGWNRLLRAEATKDHNDRYVQIADLDALRARNDQGDGTAEPKVRQILATTRDGKVRSLAEVVEAAILTERGEAAAALKLLAEADADAVAISDSSARALVWEIEGVTLMSLHDLKGSATAFGRSQFEYANPGYPRPDYDPIFDMSDLAAQIGHVDLAAYLYAADHRLTERSDRASQKQWDDALCDMVAEARDDAKGVLDCVAPFGTDPAGFAIVAHHVLPARAIAYARVGRIADAERDMAAIAALAAKKDSNPIYAERLPEVRAAILHAKGQDGDAFETLRRHMLAHNAEQADAYSKGVGQLTAEMAKQMNVRQLQLSTAQKNLALVDRVVRDQRILSVMGAIVGIGILLILVWQFKVLSQLRAARAEAEAGSRAKGEFLANMSHEIRTPLNGLLTMAELMDRSPLPAEQRSRLAVVRQSGQDLLRLLNDILDFSKIEAGKLELEDIEFDPRHVLESTLAGFAAAAEQKGLQIWFDVAEDAHGLRRGDPSRVRQIASNFISNALKFTQSGGVTVAVTGVGENGRDGLQFAVRDTGCGIPADKTSLLFKKFSQVDASTTRRFGGTGLGLAICQELATLMKGQVWAESVEGEGSTFYACLMIPYVGEVPAA